MNFLTVDNSLSHFLSDDSEDIFCCLQIKLADQILAEDKHLPLFKVP